jgi:hypothetical protein
MDHERWDRLTTARLIGFGIGMVAFYLLIIKSEPGFVFIVDHANLLFHEAGHPIIRIFSQRLETYGGTIGQLIFPAVLAITFWRRGESLSLAGSLVLFFENWLNIARYMADARAQVLPLVGGGDHDWANIFGRWRVLAYDMRISELVKVIGWVGMALPCLWVIWQSWRRRNEVEAPGKLEAAMEASWKNLND